MLEKIKSESIDTLFEGILKLENLDECYSFFEDVCTIKEIRDIAQRLDVAVKLREKKPYSEVAKETGASTATISRVNKCLSYGNGGYNIILERLGK